MDSQLPPCWCSLKYILRGYFIAISLLFVQGTAASVSKINLPFELQFEGPQQANDRKLLHIFLVQVIGISNLMAIIVCSFHATHKIKQMKLY
jgi:hypothetical protein